MGLEILTGSADDYFKSNGKNPADYESINLRASGHSSREGAGNALISKAKYTNCEAVVGVTYHRTTRRSGGIFARHTLTRYTAVGNGLKLKNPA